MRAEMAQMDRNVIGRGITVKGDLIGEGDIIVEGRVDGRVDLKSELVVEPSGEVGADVRARRVTIRGRAGGTVAATESIVLEPSAVVQGELHAPSVQIEEGAEFNGLIDMDVDLPERT